MIVIHVRKGDEEDERGKQSIEEGSGADNERLLRSTSKILNSSK